MKRRNSIKQTIVKSVVFIFLCAFVIYPIVPVIGWAQAFGWFKTDSRKANAISFTARPVDQKAKPELFKEPLLSVTFDDGWGSVFTEAYPLLQKYGIHTTQYVISGEFDDKQYMSKKQVKTMQATGHEIGCHSVTHANLAAVSDQELTHQLADCQKTLQDLGLGSIKEFASPYSSSTNKTIAAIGKYYRSQRNTDGDPTNGIGDPDFNIAASFDPYELISVTIHRNTAAKQIEALINYAKANNCWLILTYHAVDDGPSEYGLTTGNMDAQLKAMHRSDIRIATIGQVLDQYQLRNKR